MCSSKHTMYVFVWLPHWNVGSMWHETHFALYSPPGLSVGSGQSRHSANTLGRALFEVLVRRMGHSRAEGLGSVCLKLRAAPLPTTLGGCSPAQDFLPGCRPCLTPFPGALSSRTSILWLCGLFPSSMLCPRLALWPGVATLPMSCCSPFTS